MTETVEGELSLGSGWWLALPQTYELDYDDDGDVVLQRVVVRLTPQVVSFDASSMTESTAEISIGVVADTVADAGGRLRLLGPISGRGWSGSFCGGVADAGLDDEYEIIASLGAAGTVLNLSFTYLGVQTADEVRWIVDHAVYRPETAEFTSQLATEDIRLSVPPGSLDAGPF